MFLHRASFQGEGVLLRLMHTSVRYHIRHQLREGWVREILYRRAVEAGAAESEAVRQIVMNSAVETLIATNWHWYEPLMFARRGSGRRVVFVAVLFAMVASAVLAQNSNCSAVLPRQAFSAAGGFGRQAGHLSY